MASTPTGPPLHPHAIRRQFNRAFFEGIWLNETGIVRSKLASPFAELEAWAQWSERSASGVADEPHLGAEALTPGEVYQATEQASWGYERQCPGMAGASVGQGLKDDLVVELRGIEPLASSMRPRRSAN